MLTLENTQGFNQDTLDKMNAEVESIMDSEYIAYYHDYEDFLYETEKKVLARYGGLR